MPRPFTKGENGRVHLSDEIRALPLDQVHAAILEAGYAVSRVTAWRAKSKGSFVPGYREGAARLAGDHVGWISLTMVERQYGASLLARRFHIEPATAQKGIARGWLEVTVSNAAAIQVEEHRIKRTPPPTKVKPLVSLVPDVIRAAPDGRPLGALTVSEIAAIFGLTPTKAGRARQRGEVRTRGWPWAKRRELARRLQAQAGVPAPAADGPPAEG